MKKYSLVLLLFGSLCAQATVVRFETVLGHFDVQLFDDVAPVTVQNFLKYVNDDDYDGTFIHRTVSNFIIQGGGYRFNGHEDYPAIPVDPPIVNEFQRSNTRGTIAMAKVEGNPNSATSQWFINLKDNASNLDNQNGGFTVFGEVLGSGMDIVDAIAALPVENASYNGFTAFNSVPVIDYSGGDFARENFVIINDIRVLPDPIVINAAMSGAWFNPNSNSQGLFFEVLPTANQVFMGWFTYDTQLADSSLTATVGAPGQRWLSGQGSISGNRVVLDVMMTSNGLFNSNAEVDRTEPGAYGTVTVTFEDCSSGVVEYDLTAANQSGSFQIVRIANDNVALCEQLAVTIEE